MIPNEEFDYTLLKSVLAQYSGIRQKIHELLQSGVITRVKKGLYVFGSEYNQAPICKEVLANLIYGPSYKKVMPDRIESDLWIDAFIKIELRQFLFYGFFVNG